MKVKAIARNLAHPRGNQGHIVSEWLIENKPVYVQLLDYIEAKEESHLLEIGYGPGYGIEMVCASKGCAIDGIDISHQMFLQAWKYLNEIRKTGGVRLLCGDFLTYKLNQNMYDCVFFCNVIYFWKELKQYFSKISTVLKPGGRSVLFMGDPDNLRKGKASQTTMFNKHSIADVVSAMDSAGIVDTRIEKFREEDGCYYIIGTRAK